MQSKVERAGNTYDVIVVGGGGSGLAAAVSAAQHGASVAVFEKQPELGGSTGIAVGSFTTNRTGWQQRAGIEDSPEAHAEDAGKFPPSEYEAVNNDELRAFFVAHSNKTLEWLRGMGLAFHGPSPEPPNRVPRMHNVVPAAKAYILCLQKHLLRHGGVIYCGAPVTRLLEESGRVCGVEAEVDGAAQTFTATRGVVLAAGDYAAAPDLIARYKGEEFKDIEGIFQHAHGDGHRLAESVGANLINMQVTYGPEIRFVPPEKKPLLQRLPAGGFFHRIMGALTPLAPKPVLNFIIKQQLVTWQHPENALFDDGAILINSQGERFCNEKDSPLRETAIAKQPGKICYIVLDEKLVRKYSEWPDFISTAPEIAYAYVEDYKRLRPDVTVAGAAPAGLAEARGIPAENLEKTIAAYNAYTAGEAPDAFGRTGDTEPLAGGEWVLLGPAKAYFTTTEGSPAIDLEMRVLKEDGGTIPGLYAVGQNGLGGQVLWGHGLHIAWALTSGRLAGEKLAEKT